MTQECWDDLSALALGVYLDGSDAPDLGPDGQPLLDDDFLVLVNGWWEPIDFTIPDPRPGMAWHVAIDTFDPAGASGAFGAPAASGAFGASGASAAPGRRAGEQVRVEPRSVLVLRGPRGADA
jgi:glycogen operon protein